MDLDKIHIFIDTSTLEDLGYSLNSSPLRKILSADEIVLHTTSVTVFEVRARMNLLLAQVRSSSAKMSRRGAPGDWRDPDLTLNAYSECCAYEHDGSGANLGDLVRLFVECSPPFSRKKREEFKDAIAMLSLHHWAVHNNKIVYIVAEDGDWKDACANFPQFKLVRLGEISGMLHRLDAERVDVDNDRIEHLIEIAEDKLMEALDFKPPEGGNEGVQTVCESISVRAMVQTARTRGDEVWARASFSGVASAEVVDKHGNIWGVSSSRINGILEATFSHSYDLISINIQEWIIDLTQDPARREIALARPPMGDQS